LALLHIRIRNAYIPENRAQRAKIGSRFLGRSHIRLRHDFEKRDTGTVQIDARIIAACDGHVVDRFTRVLFEMCARNPDASRPAFCLCLIARLDIEPAARNDRVFELRYLIALGQIRIEVILARKDRMGIHRRVNGEPQTNRQLDHAFIQHGQYTGQREIDRMHRMIRGRAIGHGRRTEELRSSLEMRMHLEPDHHLIAIRPVRHQLGSGLWR